MVVPASEQCLRPPVILLDPFDECEMYAHVLRMAGFEPVVCEDVDTAMATVLGQPVRAVLTRIVQRGPIDGIEFTQRGKADPRTSHVPVLIISTQTHPRFRQSAQMVGCGGFLMLP